jgi:hypothetical protein
VTPSAVPAKPQNDAALRDHSPEIGSGSVSATHLASIAVIVDERNPAVRKIINRVIATRRAKRRKIG